MPINMTIQQMAWKKKLKKNTKKLNELSDLENKIEQNRKRLLFVKNFFNLLFFSKILGLQIDLTLNVI